MYEYINKMLMELQSDMKRLSKTPATGNFLNTNPDTKKLPEDKAQLFHHLVAKLFSCAGGQHKTYKLLSHFYARGLNNQMKTTTIN